MMLTINEAMELTHLPYSTIRRLCLEGKVIYIRSGKKFYINKNSLVSFLSGEVNQNGSANGI